MDGRPRLHSSRRGRDRSEPCAAGHKALHVPAPRRVVGEHDRVRVIRVSQPRRVAELVNDDHARDFAARNRAPEVIVEPAPAAIGPRAGGLVRGVVDEVEALGRIAATRIGLPIVAGDGQVLLEQRLGDLRPARGSADRAGSPVVGLGARGEEQGAGQGKDGEGEPPTCDPLFPPRRPPSRQASASACTCASMHPSLVGSGVACATRRALAWYKRPRRRRARPAGYVATAARTWA